jgi:hypothetical protein
VVDIFVTTEELEWLGFGIVNFDWEELEEPYFVFPTPDG